MRLLAFVVLMASVDVAGNSPSNWAMYFQVAGNYGIPSGQCHFPVSVSVGPNTLLPVVSGGLDLRSTLSYSLQTGGYVVLSESGTHGLRTGIGLTRRDVSLDYFDYEVEFNGTTLRQELDEILVSYTELELACSYLFSTRRMRFGAGLLGIAWRRQAYRDRFLDGRETRVISPFFVRFRDWYPTMYMSYSIRSVGPCSFTVFMSANRRGFRRELSPWWDCQLGIAFEWAAVKR